MEEHKDTERKDDSPLEKEIVQLFSDLKHFAEEGNITSERIELICQKLLRFSFLDYKEKKVISVPIECLNTFMNLLRLDNYEITTHTLTTISVLAKLYDFRSFMHDEPFISYLCQRLRDVSGKKEINELTICKYLCRALGNICYYHARNSELVAKHGGIVMIIGIVRQGLAMEKGDHKTQLLTYATGFMLNFLTLEENVPAVYPPVTKEEMLDLLATLFELEWNSEKDETICYHTIIILGLVIEQKDLDTPMLNERLYKCLCDMFKKMTTEDSISRIIEIVYTQIGHIEGAICFTKAGLGEALSKILVDQKDKAHLSGDERAYIFRDIIELATMVISEVDSMVWLYDSGNGDFYKSTLQWMTDPDLKELRDTGLRFLGNFARQDDVCIRMGGEGLILELKMLLDKQKNKEEELSIQCLVYAISTLKNLLVPKVNKSIAALLGVQDTLLPLAIQYEMNGTVMFKLFGAMRMIVDGQDRVAKLFGKDEQLLKLIVNYGQRRDLFGVQDEAQRLICWITKSARVQKVYLKMAQSKATLAIAEMLDTKHEVMQMEAILALFLIGSKYLSKIEDEIISANVMEKLEKLLKAEELRRELFDNILSLMSQWSVSGRLKEEMKNCGMGKLIKERAKLFDITEQQESLTVHLFE